MGDHVQIDRQTVTFDRTCPYWLDVAVLRRGLAPGQSSVDLAVRQAAVDLYQGEFLHGFYVRDAPAFDLWVVEQREQLHTLVVNALTGLVDEYALNGNAVAALAANRRLLVLEPWSEPTHRQQMRLLAQTGDRAAALAQYEICRRVLAAEFGIEPLPETTALYEQIRAGEGRRPEEREPRGQEETVAGLQSQVLRQSTKAASQAELRDAEYRPRNEDPVPNAPPIQVVSRTLPLRTKLYGRQAELANLQQWVATEGCRLVGIFGIGGQGKTALAATFVSRLAETPPPLNPGGRLGRDTTFHPHSLAIAAECAAAG